MKKFLLFFSLSFLIVASNCFSQTMVEAPYYDMSGTWDSSPYQSFQITGGTPNPWYDMTFRLLFPKNYDGSLVSTTTYPMVIMLHGAGESALGNSQFNTGAPYQSTDPRFRNNDHQLLHQGQAYINAVNASPTSSRHWPGFVLFPQNPNGFWTGTPWILDEVIEMIQVLTTNYKIDPNRIYVSGLSAGSHGAWDGLARYTSIFAAANIMSGIGNPTYDNTTRVAHIPIWYFQGGRDGSPTQWTADRTINELRNAGGTPKYTVYENSAHNTWNQAISEADYLPFLLRHSKLSIHTYFGKTEFCAGEQISAKLEISPGFSGYEWKKNDILIPGATSNSITVTEIGNYTVRFRRGTQWTPWSAATVIKIKTPTATPTITASGSTALTALDGKTSVTLSAPAGYANYRWSNGATTQSITVSTAGTFTVQVTEAGGCISNPSAPVVVTVGNGSNPPLAPTEFVATAASPTILDLSWNDNSSNETGFEVYRAVALAGPYTFLGLTAQNVNTFKDSDLEPSTTYYYKVRAISTTGPSTVLSGTGTTEQDMEAPSIPQNLTYLASIPTEIYLSWNASTDYVGVTEYLIYANGIQVASTENTSYSLPAVPGEAYTIYVKATDKSNNVSAQSNQVVAFGINKGLKYSYYEGEWNALPDFSTLSVAKTGHVPNFSLTPRDQNDYFAMQFEGYFYATATGSYTFATRSDDGSKLYIGNTEVVNNDGLHGATIDKTGEIKLEAGTAYPIRVTFFEKTGGERLEVKYALPGSSQLSLIPDAALVDTDISLSLPTAPNTLAATVNSFQQITLTWKDNSNDETGFEIFRSSPNNSGHQIIATVPAGTTSYVNTGLLGSTRYYYKVRAINNSGSSGFSNEVNRTTPTSPNLPAAPSTPVATALSTSQISVSWTDNSTNESAFEVQRSTSSNGAYTVVYTSAPNVTTYTDNGLNTYTTYYYKVRAVNSGAYSAFTSVVNARTLTNAPILTPVGNKIVSEGSRADYTLSATDEDNDDLTFSLTTDLPFIAIANSGGNIGTLTVLPGYTHAGTYEDIIITVSDGKGGISSETISVTVTNVNRSPSLSPIGNKEVNEESSLTINLSSSDPDGEPVTLAVTSGLPSFASFSDNGNGTGTITANPEIGNAGNYNITVQTTDPNSATASETFALKVNKLNLNAPVIAPIGNKTVNENTTQNYSITATDGDGDIVTLSASNLPAFATFTATGNGTGTLAVAPNFNHSGVYSNIVFSANDGNGGTSTQAISITVNNINRAPVITTIGNKSVNEGTLLTVTVSASDADGDALSISASNLPAFATFTANNNTTATIKFSPGFSNSGTYGNITIATADGKGGSDTETFELTVVDVPGGSQTIIYRINSGGEGFSDSPMNWSADTYSNPSPYLVQTGSTFSDGGCWFAYGNTTGAPNCLFGSLRYDWGTNPIKYDLPVTNGNYIVNLYFAQKPHWDPNNPIQVGQHTFDVYLESDLVLNDFDMFAENNYNAIKKTFNLQIADELLNIQFVGTQASAPQINGIEIISVVGAEGFNVRLAAPEETTSESKGILVMPNPLGASSEEISLVFEKTLSENVTISILNEVGSTVFNKDFEVDNANSVNVNLSGISLRPGLYLIKVNSKTLKNQTVKLLKE